MATNDAKDNKKAVDTKNKKEKVPELSEEDQALKDNLGNWVDSVKSEDLATKEDAIYKIFHEVISATSSMTSIPKPMKFLVAHYQTLVDEYSKTPEGKTKQFFADLLSLLSGTLADPYEQQTYKYLKQGTGGDFLQWGHEFQLQLAGDISKIYAQRLDAKEDQSDLIELAGKLVKYFIKCNSEIDAIDLLLEIDHLEMAMDLVDKDNIRKIYDYLLASTPFSADQDEYNDTLRWAFKYTMRVEEYFLALRVAMKLDDQSLVEEAFNACQDPILRKQLAFSLGRQRLVVPTKDSEIESIISNTRLNEFYLKLLKDLDVEKPKHPDDVYKSHLENKKSADLESAQLNLAMTYTNAFVNAASTKDSLMQAKEPWITHVKNEGIMAATASLGLIHLWNVEESTSAISDYLDLKDGYAKAGALIGVGIANSGVWSEVDPARAILEDNINSSDPHVRLGAAMGLGLAYAGTAREEFRDILCPIITDLGIGTDTASFAALSLGLIFVSKCDEEVVNTILTALMQRPESELNQASARYYAVALALTYLGQQERCEPAIETLKVIEHPLARYAEVCVEAAAYVGSGNVLKIQEFLKKCIPHEADEVNTLPQSMAVLGIAFIAISEKIGNEMAGRLMNHILQYCDLPVKRAIPIAIGMLNISNPTILSTDLLSKLAHDEDKEMSMRAILSMGLIGLGTNNSRIAGLLRNLAAYYYNDPGHVYLIRIAQGLLSTGKGLMTANPFYSDLFLYSKVSMAGLFIIANSMLDMKNIMVEKFHYVIYYLVCSIYPRWLFTLDEDLQNFPVTVRVGQAVDTVGQVGNPRTITGFQTHTAPIIFSYGDRAEVGAEEWIPSTKNLIIENFVIIKKNPDYEKNKDQQPRKKTSASIYF